MQSAIVLREKYFQTHLFYAAHKGNTLYNFLYKPNNIRKGLDQVIYNEINNHCHRILLPRQEKIQH